VTIKSIILWNVMPRIPVEVHLRFGLLLAGFLLRLLLDPEDGVSAFLQKSVNVYRTTRLYIPENSTLYS
jgi:hypothetical protein